MSKFPITKKGFIQIQEEVDNLKNIERPNIIKAISEARDHGDLKENAEYHSAREKQGFIEGRIIDLEDKIARAQVIDPEEVKSNKILFGATVTLINLETEKEVKYQIVSEYEADIDKGLISIVSPIAKAMMSKEVDDEVVVTTPAATKEYQVMKIEYI